ncbi:MAG: NADH-quinone oxidoreductase subunit NuoH [Ktedonobacterales bacterium]
MSDLLWAIAAAIVKGGIAIVALLTAFAYMTLIERRVIARMQSRLGPNRLGPFGAFQPLADAIKMAFKEQIIPTQARTLVYLVAPCISVFIALVAFAVVPLGGPNTWGTGPIARAWAPYVADLNVGILYILSISSLAVYGIVLGGWSSGNRYSLLGALRSAAQMVSYEVSIGLSLAGVLMFAGTLSMVGIVQAQTAPHVWFVLAQPLGFMLYGIAAVAEVNRAPFDLPEAEQELTAGYLTEFSGLRWSLYQMAEYINMITVSSIAVTLFFGGWTLGSLDGVLGLPFIWYLLNVVVLLFVFIWLRATLPRIRYDRLMRFGWETLLPLSVLNLVATAAIITLVPEPDQWWAGLIFGLVVLAAGSGIYAGRRRTFARSKSSVLEVGLLMPRSVRLVHLDGAPAGTGNGTPARSAPAVAPGAEQAAPTATT